MKPEERNPANKSSEKKGFSLPPTKAKPKMPNVNPPKKQK